MTNDGLVAFNQASGLAGTQLVPDLAVSLPTPTDGGRTYTFQLRPGIRYSNGRPVKASDFRSTFERDFEIGAARPRTTTASSARLAASSARSAATSRAGIVADDAAKHRHLPSRRARPGVPVQARAPLRVRRARRHAAARYRHASAAGDRAVHDRELPPEPRAQARPQPALPRVVEGGAAGRLPGRDRRSGSAARRTRR